CVHAPNHTAQPANTRLPSPGGTIMRNRKARRVAGVTARAGGALTRVLARAAYRFRWQLVPFTAVVAAAAAGVVLRTTAAVGGWWFVGTAAALTVGLGATLYQASRSGIPRWYLAVTGTTAVAGITAYVAADNPATGLAAAGVELGLLGRTLFGGAVAASILGVPWWLRFSA